MNLFSFFKPSHHNPIQIDLHSHLIPGIDDGVKTLEESLQIIKKFQILGYTKLITTPHIMSDLDSSNKRIISEKLEEVRYALKERNIEICLESSAEYYVDMNFLSLIEDDELLPFMGRYILFETSYTNKPMMLEQTISDLKRKGYIPVLAHPERYTYLKNDIELYKRLKVQGVLFQINIKSLHSKKLRKTAMTLIQGGLVDFVGSDVHSMRDILKLEKTLKTSAYQRIMKKNKILNNIL